LTSERSPLRTGVRAARILRPLDALLQSALADRAVFVLVKLWSSAALRRAPAEGLRQLLRLDESLQKRIDVLAIDLDGGIHAKHRLTRYHDFFVERVHASESVLDVGCGKGELAYDLATQAGARVTGIDVNPAALAFARERFHAPGLQFVEADALIWQPPSRYDVAVLSNVLEHIAPRVELLQRLRELAHVERFLIRVPSIERDWLVALRGDLGLDSRSDPTHEIEYTEHELRGELAEAGLQVDELVARWGELWAVATPVR
jgi:SAM-dependent methyltransferase